jgi:hypothetical protein
VFSALNPALLGGLALVGVPIIIHLLLRKRPKPRPWAAMRWLLAAARKAQRKYRLTNLLLLLARCAIVALAVLAVTRPTLAGLGGGARLVIIVDRTASMGARGSDPGPLAAAKAALAQAHLSYQSVAVAAVDARAEVICDGSAGAAMDAIGALEAVDLPGGLDAGARGDSATQLASLCSRGADVLLISDFAQDDGAALAAALAPASRSLSRWRVGAPGANGAIVGIDGSGDLLPNAPSELIARVAGKGGEVQLAVDDAPFVSVGSVPDAPAGAGVRVAVPPLTEGPHRLRLRLNDDSLAYDNLLELPVIIRPRVEALAVQEAPDYVGAALGADNNRSFAFRAITPAQLAAEALPARGVVALRAIAPGASRLKDWVQGGGVLWADARLLLGDSGLKELVAGLELGATTRPGGPYVSGDRDIDEVLSVAHAKEVPAATLPPSAEVLLRAGKEPVVVAMPAGRGWVVAELRDLASDRDLQARGTTPLWVVRTARKLASRLDSPRLWTAGTPAPTEATLKRGGDTVAVKAGEPLMLAPGAWSGEGGTVVVLPNPEEGRLERIGGGEAATRLERALPKSRGADLGWALAALMLAAAIGEGLFAAWAGRTYGR